MSKPPQVSAIVPARDSESQLADTVARLARALARAGDSRGGGVGEGGEILVVENGSSDGTWALARELADDDADVPVRALRSAVGLGRAYAAGLRHARCEVALLTADDLPFGLTDLQAWRLAGRPAGLVVGSKAHPGSDVPRPVVRRALTAGFGWLGRRILDLDVGDTQGTVFVPTAWAQRVLPQIHSGGYLFPTELLFVAQSFGVPITEVPVTLDAAHAEHPTRIRARDVTEMATGLVGLRRRHDLRNRP
ncbi:MAG: glycosyltransferase [Dermatophilaceae bacterium]